MKITIALYTGEDTVSLKNLAATLRQLASQFETDPLQPTENVQLFPDGPTPYALNIETNRTVIDSHKK